MASPGAWPSWIDARRQYILLVLLLIFLCYVFYDSRRLFSSGSSGVRPSGLLSHGYVDHWSDERLEDWAAEDDWQADTTRLPVLFTVLGQSVSHSLLLSGYRWQTARRICAVCSGAIDPLNQWFKTTPSGICWWGHAFRIWAWLTGP